MKQVSLFLAMLFIAISVCGAADRGPANRPQFIQIEVPGATATSVNGINNTGVMVGTYGTTNIENGFALFGGKLVIISVPGALGTTCQGVNSARAIVGTVTPQIGQGNPRGFLYQNGVFTDIGPGTDLAGAFGINDSGQIVGGYAPDGITEHGFLYDGAQYQTLDVPGAKATVATGINNQGLIVLQWGGSDGHTHGALYDGTQYTTIDVPGASDSFPFGVNNFGDVAYTYYDSQGATRSALLRGGQYYKYMVPGSNRSFAYGLNDKDVIVGVYYDHSLSVKPGYKLIP